MKYQVSNLVTVDGLPSVSIKKPSLCDGLGVQFLKECEDVGIVNVGGLLRARVQTKSTTFLTPIAARIRVRFKSKSRPSNEPP